MCRNSVDLSRSHKISIRFWICVERKKIRTQRLSESDAHFYIEINGIGFSGLCFTKNAIPQIECIQLFKPNEKNAEQFSRAQDKHV